MPPLSLLHDWRLAQRVFLSYSSSLQDMVCPLPRVQSETEAPTRSAIRWTAHASRYKHHCIRGILTNALLHTYTTLRVPPVCTSNCDVDIITESKLDRPGINWLQTFDFTRNNFVGRIFHFAKEAGAPPVHRIDALRDVITAWNSLPQYEILCTLYMLLSSVWSRKRIVCLCVPAR